MRMTLVASVAAAYFNLIALDNELSIVRRTLITRSEGLYQVQLRFEGGLTSEMVYQQAKVEYASTAALIPDLERKIKIMENGILLLMGENPDRRVVRGKMNTDAEFADSLPVGLPSGLLQRRPDVRSSEQRLRAAMASAGMAYADRFPRLTFNLTGGLENDALSGFSVRLSRMSPGRSLRRSSVSAASRPATAPRWRPTMKRVWPTSRKS